MRQTCEVCGAATQVVAFPNGCGGVECVCCPRGLEACDDAHPGVIERLDADWRLQVEEPSLCRMPESDFSRAMKISVKVGAVLSAAAVLVAVWR